MMNQAALPCLPIYRAERHLLVVTAAMPDCRLTLNAPPRDGVFGEAKFPDVVPEAQQAAPVEALSAEGRNLLQSGMVNTNTFNCVGCPANGPDTRTLVQDTSAFPYSAVGQLMGQVTQNT